MPLSDTEIMERIRMNETATALNEQAIEALDASKTLHWESIEKIRETLSTMKAQVAGFGVVNTLVLGWIAYKLTKGMP